MKKHFAKLERIDNNVLITQETSYDFLFHLQNALLLALQEKGMLTIMQHRQAEEKLKQQRRTHAKSILEKNSQP